MITLNEIKGSATLVAYPCSTSKIKSLKKTFKLKIKLTMPLTLILTMIFTFALVKYGVVAKVTSKPQIH